MGIVRVIFGLNLIVLAIGQGQFVDKNGGEDMAPAQSNDNVAVGNNPPRQDRGKQAVLQQGALQPQAGVQRQPAVDPNRQPVAKKLPDFKPSMKVPQADLAISKECKEDVTRICGDRLLLSNLELLACMTERIEKDEDLTDECHEYLWNYKVSVTKDPKFAHVAAEVCRPAYSLHTDWGCSEHKEGDGKLIPCLLDHKNEITHKPCYHFLVKMGTIIFSDYRLVCDFIDDCHDDIKNHQCARLPARSPNETPSKSHSQGAVITCLEEAVADGEEVNEKCAKQIIRLSELSSDDYHLDRNLYFACKNDREQLCEEVAAGEGRVYRCLFQHKFDDEMSPICREALTTRQRLVAQDYKASYIVQQTCKLDIKNLNCMAHPEYKSLGGNDHSDILGLSGMLLCMENAKLSDESVKISPECDSALVEFRRMLTEDYKMSPEIVHSCKNEISQNCEQNGLVKNGGTVHCLMGLAQKDAKAKRNEEPHVGAKCLKAMVHLLREDHAVSDYKMDRALAKACGPVASTLCKHHEKGDPLVLSCLVENLHSKGMTAECKQRLLELQFFLARDFSLDVNFYRKCSKDAVKHCNYKLDQQDSEVSMPFSMVMSCLYRHIPNVPKAKAGHITPECAEEVHRVMKSRALDFELNPDLEKACIYFLGQYCSESQIDKGYELVCLQDHFENISSDAQSGVPGADECVETLEDLTELEEADADDLDNILLKACTPDIDSYCSTERDSDEDGELMKCLVENKKQLNSDCRLGVEHMQIIELQDVKFSYNFMKACDADIKTNCHEILEDAQEQKSPVRKNEIIECLSENHLKNVLSQKPSPLSEDCAAQLTLENFQRHDDNMKLNPEIRKVCQADYKKFCKTAKVKGLECLRLHHDEISPKCRKQLFKLQQEEAVNPNLDNVLMRMCKGSIMQLCDASANPQSILDCLIHNKNKLDQKCRKIVKEREREEFSDIDLNPQLLQACRTDLRKHCSDILRNIQNAEQQDFTEEEIHGQAINCLKEVESDLNAKEQLSDQCASHVRFIMKEEEEDYKLDPMLTLNCIDSIQSLCPPDSSNDVVQCLKVMYFQGHLSKDRKCMVQVARLLKEGRSDIMADPVLHNACQPDIQRECHGIAEGRGRIMTCILSVVDSGRASQPCAEAIQERKEMWKYAENTNVESFGHLAAAVYSSPHSSYLMTILSLILLGILIFGICCGRVTKRISRQRKML